MSGAGAAGWRGGRPRAAALPAVVAAVAVLGGGEHAHATVPGDDGVYGRFGGDLDLGLGAGAALRTPALDVRASAHAFSTAGVVLGLRQPLADDAADPGTADEAAARRLSAGVELRPLFVPRWASGLEVGPAWLDLTLDSLALGMAAWYAPGTTTARGGFAAHLGLGVPLLSRADGPWLELRGELSAADAGARRAPPAQGEVIVALAWHGLVISPWVSADKASGRGPP